MLLAIRKKPPFYPNLLYWGTLGLFAFLIIRYQIRLLDYFEWGDESETIVTAKMMAAGHKLYSDVFNMHGPLTFLQGYLLEQFGSFGIKAHRIVMILMQWAAFIALYCSPFLKNRWLRFIYVVVAASFYLVYLPELFSHTYTYQAIAGLLLVIVLSQYVLPSIGDPKDVSNHWIFMGNALLMCLPFLAITYIPVTLFLVVASFRVHALKITLIGLLIGLLMNLIFLGLTGSFAGYAAIHYYLNLKVVPLFLGGASPLELIQAALINATSGMQAILASAIILLACIRLALKSNSICRATLLLIGIESLLLRGSGFQGLPYWYAVSAIPLIFFKETIFINRYLYLCILAVLMACLVKLLIILPEDKTKIRSKPVPKSTLFSELVKGYTNKEDRILAYSFQNYQYILSDRLPGSGNFFYLPWQAKYAENPVLGIRLDVCDDIKNNRPKMLLIDKMNVNGAWPWETYAQCIQDVVDRDYKQIQGTHYYIRSDVFPAELQIEKN